ncbi:hypothetical protein HK100_007726 [Physocladia obscura]|uniref:Uncharacterized protein n=1 Tax=Physocladia obscura TaxID=109957 RepID=A0AAD5SRD6_9FUNG|nr:hypothetical protein HK100_007726 [Physocladia obscura]
MRQAGTSTNTNTNANVTAEAGIGARIGAVDVNVNSTIGNSNIGNNSSSSANSNNNNNIPLDAQFRTAALAVTNLYRASQAAKHAAFEEGYAACFEDLLAALVSEQSQIQHQLPAHQQQHLIKDSILVNLITFMTAKQDLVHPASTESLLNIISAASPTNQQPPQQQQPPVFTFTATPAVVSAADRFHRAHPVSRKGSNKKSDPAFSWFSPATNADLSGVFTGVDFSLLGLDNSNNNSVNDGSNNNIPGKDEGKGGDAADHIPPVAIAADIPGLNVESTASSLVLGNGIENGVHMNTTNSSDAALFTAAVPVISGEHQLQNPLKRRWDMGLTVNVSSGNVDRNVDTSGVANEEEDSAMSDDSDIHAKRVRWISNPDSNMSE